MTNITTQAARNANPNADLPVEGRERKLYNNILNNRHRIVCSSCYFINWNDKKNLEQLRTGFKRTIKWNKYRSEMTYQTKNNNLNYLVDPTFTNVGRLFVVSFENENDGTYFSKYYVTKPYIKMETQEVVNF